MSCLSCKTNRYLTNIYKSQQRVTLSVSHPRLPSASPSRMQPETLHCKKGVQLKWEIWWKHLLLSLQGGIPEPSQDGECMYGISKILGRWNMKLHSLAMASTEPSVLEERAKRCTHCSHTGMQRVQSNGQGGATAFGPQPPPPADSRKGAADCIKKFTVHCRVSNCLRLFFLMQF